MIAVVSLQRVHAQSSDSTATEQEATQDAASDFTQDNNSSLESDKLWENANNAYINGEYERAASLYTQILSRGEHSDKLYYNLGNAYFKQNRLGKAILNYNRALEMSPQDEDIAYNLALANARTIDKIESVPEFFVKRWIRELGYSLSSNSWAILSLIFFAIALTSAVAWLLSNVMTMRKAGFFTMIICGVLTITSLIYSSAARERVLNGTQAIVMNIAAPVKSSPGAGSKDIFVLHEGTKVNVLEELDGWCEISIADGNKGWIAKNAIETLKN